MNGFVFTNSARYLKMNVDKMYIKPHKQQLINLYKEIYTFNCILCVARVLLCIDFKT